MNLNYVEFTGPMTRVGVIVEVTAEKPELSSYEEEACRFAMEHLGTDTTPSHTDLYSWGWEVVFETAYL